MALIHIVVTANVDDENADAEQLAEELCERINAIRIDGVEDIETSSEVADI